MPANPTAARSLLCLLCIGGVSSVEAAGSGHLPWYALGFLFVFWGLCFVGIFYIFSCLRAKNQAGFDEARGLGLVLEEDGEEKDVVAELDEEEKLTILGGFLNSFPNEEMSHEMGLDASLYLAHAMQLTKFWAFHFCTTGIILIMTYQIAGDKRSTVHPAKDDAVYAAAAPPMCLPCGPSWVQPATHPINACWDETIMGVNMTDTSKCAYVEVLDAWTDFYAMSYGTLYCTTKSCGWAIIVPIIMSFWLVISNVLFAAYRQKLMDTIKIEAEGENIHTSLFTILLRGVDTITDQEPYKAYFEEAYPGHVVGIHIAMNYTDLSVNIRNQSRSIRKMNKIVDDGGEEVAAYEEFQRQLTIFQADETTLRAVPEVSTGIIFVTFDAEVYARQFLADHRAHTVPDQLSIKGAKASLAPLPGDMYWENIAVTRGERYVRMCWTWLATAAIFSVFMGFACLMVFFIGFDYMKILYNAKGLPEYTKVVDSVRDTLGFFLFYGVCTTILAVAFLILEEEIPPIVKYFTKYERYMSKTKKQGAYMYKCYCHYLVYHLVISTFFLGLLTLMVDVGNRPRLFMEISGCFHCNRMMLTVAVVDAFHWCEGVKFFRRPTDVTDETQAELAFHSAEEADDEDEALEDAADAYFNNKFNFSRNYAESTAVFGAASYYAISHPLIMGFAIIYFGGKYILDKYQIVHQYSKPHFAYGRRARSTTTYLLTSMVVGRTGDPIYFLYVMPVTSAGAGFLGSFVLSALALFLYMYRNKLFKKNSAIGKAAREATGKATGRKDGSEAKQAKIDELSEECETVRDAAENFLEVYDPPSANSLQVKVELKSLSAAVPRTTTSELEMPPDDESPVVVQNPMGDDDEDDEEE